MPLSKKIREQVKWNLVDAEKLDYGTKLAQHERDLCDLEEKKKSIPEQMKAVRAQMMPLRQAILAGWEWRGVDCFERIKGHDVEVVRSDTGEVVRTRRADQSDVQVTIDEKVAKTNGGKNTFAELKADKYWMHEDLGGVQIKQVATDHVLLFTCDSLENKRGLVKVPAKKWNACEAHPREMPEIKVGLRWSWNPDSNNVCVVKSIDDYGVGITWETTGISTKLSPLNWLEGKEVTGPSPVKSEKPKRQRKAKAAAPEEAWR